MGRYNIMKWRLNKHKDLQVKSKVKCQLCSIFLNFFFISRVDLRAGNNVVKSINLHIGRVPLTTY